MIRFVQKGNFNNTNRFLTLVQRINFMIILNKYGKIGVEALSSATPVDTGKTAESWDYQIEGSFINPSIVWTNDSSNQGVNIAVILNFGHGTGTGGYVVGRQFITPAIRPIFDNIAEDAWKEVTRL